MKQLSHWASQHRRTAVGLIILLETVKVTAGMNLGRFGLPALPPDLLSHLVLFVVVGIFTVQDRPRRFAAALQPDQRQTRLRRDLRWLMGGGYLLAILAGNACQNFYGDPGSYPLWEARSLEIRRDTIRPVAEPQVQQGHYPANRLDEQPRQKGRGWKILGYTLLFLVGVAAVITAPVLACALACSGYGVLALLVLLVIMVGYPVLAVTVARVFRKDRKRLRDMTPDERKRETVAILTGLGLALLIFLLTMLIV